MTQQPQQSQQPPQPSFGMPPFDPAAMQAIWQQMMGQFPQSNAHQQAPPASMPAEMLKQMQKACLDSMARWVDDYMRSPQFLEQMKRSLEGALAMRRQVEGFIRKATEQSYGSTLGMYDAVGAVRDAETWITRRIDELASRLDAIEDKLGVEKKARRPDQGAKRAQKTTARPAPTGTGRTKTAKTKTARKKTAKQKTAGKRQR